MSAPLQPVPGSAATADPPAPPEMPAIPRAKTGYHPGQVHRYVRFLLDRIYELENTALHHTGGAARTALHAAESPEGKALLADLMKLALDEITGQKEAAAAEIADMKRRATQDAEAQLKGATSQATSIVAAAEQEAEKLTAAAREQSDTALATAHGQAKSIVDRASLHAAAVDEGAQRRLDNMTGLHEETVRRLTEIHEVTGGFLDKDRQRGTLQQEVTVATTALVGSQAAPAPLPPGPAALPPSEPSATEGVVDDVPADDPGTLRH